DTCRICSAPAEPDQPLFHPCKCSGTIRYIHQDCLTTWLNHSKKKTCDVCKHPYAFTKVYAQDMPNRLPAILVVRQFAKQTVTTMFFICRGVLVAVVWLAVLPWVTVWTWRMYFTMGDSTAWWISDRSRPVPGPGFPYFPFYLNETTFNQTESGVSNNTLYARVTSHPVWMAISADIFAGQIIASLIVLTSVSVFLLREWIVQNARPGVFEELDVPLVEEDEAVAAVNEPAEAPAPVDVDANPPEGDSSESEGESHIAPHASEFRIDPSGDEVTPESNAGTSDPPLHLASGHYHSGEPSLEDRRRVMRKAAVRRRRMENGESSDSSSSDSPPPSRPRPKFHTRYGRRSSSEPRTIGSSPSYLDGTENDLRRLRPFPPPAVPSSSTLRSPASVPRRPPLPTSGRSSKVNTPLASPGLATYRAPEDLAAGPSDYFNEEAMPSENLEHEHHKYFKQAGSSSDSSSSSTGSLTVEELEFDELSDSFPSLDSLDTDSVDDENEPEAEIGEEDVFLDDQPAHADLDRQIREDLPLGEAEGPGVEGNEDFDAFAEDNDMDGALEVIGLRGPIFGIFQNAALVIFVLDTIIGLGIWVPFTIGKTTALLTLDPPRLLKVLHFPIRVIQVFTDPILDALLFIASRVLLPSVWTALSACAQAVGRMSVALMSAAFGDSVTSKATEYTLAVPSNGGSSASIGRGPLSLIDWMFESDVQLARWAEPHFAALGRRVRIGATAAAAIWVRMALGNGPLEKIFATILGYAVVGLLLAIYLNMLTAGNMRNAGRAIRSTIRQQFLIIKVAAFIVFELVVFPFGCGLMLDLSSIWLFPRSSYESRWIFFCARPITAVFYHWVGGTMFMYHFAMLLSGCRDIMRPGAMWFIKDPQDQNFHPIRDILERPTLTHLRKLLISAEMYSAVIVAGVGSVGGFMWMCTNVLPIRWMPQNNLSEVPIDLLVMLSVLPYTMQHFRPSKPIKTGASALWKFLSKKLRLTSYMLGIRVADEEITPAYSAWTLFESSQIRAVDLKDGGFRRVPASDHIALARDMRGTAAVDENGVPLTEVDSRIIQSQNAEAEKAGRQIKDDYMIVYVPPHFKWRLALFVLGLWTAGAAATTAVISCPIMLGRAVFKLVIAEDVHDGYSFFLGFYLLYGCFVVGRAFDRMDKRRQRAWPDDDEVSSAPRSLYVLKRTLVWLAQILYMVAFCGFILPTLLSLVVEVYLILPIRFSMNSNFIPRVRLIDMWALGLLYTRIALKTHHLHSRTGIARGLQKIARNGWTSPDPWSATVEVIAPAFGGLAGMLLLPALVVLSFRKFLDMQVDNRFLLMHVFPGIFAAAGLYRTANSLNVLFASWSQTIRDNEFLVEMRLRNMEP
ncbi:hypothetical protein PUNSTDRAFT_35157, partial [Punctularia strigosozonata HHB-11173 SS5]|uniref:uncharacterized protein n=1 Tax=Punctularia strigosozonata (strain HHB-11173) TaxID=741275 RepID=UPI0004417910